MSVEAGGGGEPFVADVAYVRLLPRVGPRVALQKARTVEALAADLSERMKLFLPSPKSCDNSGLPKRELQGSAKE